LEFLLLIAGILVLVGVFKDSEPTAKRNKKAIGRLESQMGRELSAYDARVVAPMRSSLGAVVSQLASLGSELEARESELRILRRRVGELEEEVDRLRRTC
jgi:hypothetical protein